MCALLSFYAAKSRRRAKPPPHTSPRASCRRVRHAGRADGHGRGRRLERASAGVRTNGLRSGTRAVRRPLRAVLEAVRRRSHAGGRVSLRLNMRDPLHARQGEQGHPRGGVRRGVRLVSVDTPPHNLCRSVERCGSRKRSPLQPRPRSRRLRVWSRFELPRRSRCRRSFLQAMQQKVANAVRGDGLRNRARANDRVRREESLRERGRLRTMCRRRRDTREMRR
jgi:hypothetical protein